MAKTEKTVHIVFHCSQNREKDEFVDSEEHFAFSLNLSPLLTAIRIVIGMQAHI